MKFLRIADLCESVNVGFVGPSTRERDVNGVPFLMGKNIGPGYLKLKSLDRVKKDFHLKNKKSQLRVGDIVVVRIGNSGQAVQIPEEFAEANCAGLVIIKRPNSLVNPNYLVYYLNSPQGRAYSLSKATGTTRQTLNTKTVAETLVPIPSLEKQREIVEKLDSAFAEIDLLEENLGSSDIKTNELLQSILSSAFTPEAEVDLSANQGSVVRTVRLSEISTFKRGLTYSKSDEVEHSNNIVLRANNIDLNTNSLNFDELRYIKDSIQIKEDKIVMKDSIIICTASGSKSHVGKVALIDKDYGYAFGGFMGQITPTDKCNPKYLYYILISEKFKEFLMNLNDGTNINNLKFSDIANYELSLPSLEEQCEIVEKLDSAFAEIQSLKAQIRTKKDYAVSLRQSLLSSAFTQEEAVA